MRPQAVRVASHSRARRTWQTSRTSFGVTRRTTAPRLGSRSMMPMPARAISASRMGVWLTPKRFASSCVTRCCAGAEAALENVGQQRLHDGLAAEAAAQFQRLWFRRGGQGRSSGTQSGGGYGEGGRRWDAIAQPKAPPGR